MKQKRLIQDLQGLYADKKLIPFVGAGLSYPFKIPTWGQMIKEISNRFKDDESFHKPVVALIEKGDYDFALQYLMNIYSLTERDIQEEIKNIIREKRIQLDAPRSHNYVDLANLDFNTVVTTNYDDFLRTYLGQKGFIAQNLCSTTISAEELNDQSFTKRIWHLHGDIHDTGTIVMTNQKYQDLYSNNKFERFFSLLYANYHFLMIGFSFDDEYIKNFFESYVTDYHSKHYLILNKPSQSLIQDLNSRYRVEVLSYEATTDEEHVIEIRKLLEEISKKKDSGEIDNSSSSGGSHFLEKLELEDKEELDRSLFCKKIKLEEIDKFTLELSKDYFFQAESYLRYLRRNNYEEGFIRSLLRIVDIKYKELYKAEYLPKGESQILIDSVHSALNSVNYGRYEEQMHKIKPLESENKGFVHILADDIKEDVWWGEKRELDV
ncbi:SIR2 family protein (plasmid) [Bacillus mycoides]|uniref:ABC-three component system protein n=1 Tax=Bacillus TaxID=1386 RepID=UPI001911C2A5|nr:MULTISPECIES: ABC-three component system protein [Bacillus]MBK5431658.1 SIR2 family protein [Bacillus sp. TH25]QWG59201.1 SIR2 family protein [Bacillus mycoides]